MKRKDQKKGRGASEKQRPAAGKRVDATRRDKSKDAPNPPRTTTGRWFTAPKFGSAGSGGLELEPGPERD